MLGAKCLVLQHGTMTADASQKKPVRVVAVVNIVLVVQVRRVPLGRRVPVHNINLVLDHRQAM